MCVYLCVCPQATYCFVHFCPVSSCLKDCRGPSITVWIIFIDCNVIHSGQVNLNTVFAGGPPNVVMPRAEYGWSYIVLTCILQSTFDIL